MIFLPPVAPSSLSCATGLRARRRLVSGSFFSGACHCGRQQVSKILDILSAGSYHWPMYASHELSSAVRTRRQEIGLTQKGLAKLAGLSRSTVAEVEAGTIKDLSFTRTAAILSALGLGVTITPAHPRLNPKVSREKPLEVAARTASTSYAGVVPAEFVSDALVQGQVPEQYRAHIHALLDEAPIALLARAVEQIHQESNAPREKVWSNMRRMARQLKSHRELWNVEG
jgi:transcriptional regulator with XRE-family HTH domain